MREMDVLMFLFFASQVFQVFGKVIVIQKLNRAEPTKELTCLSEDDGGALVCNDKMSKTSSKMRITKPSAPLINFINTTSIQVNLPVTWKEEHDGSLSYSFIIQTANNISTDGIHWKPVFENTTELTGVFTDLKPNITYHIACMLRACNQHGQLCNNISSEWHIVKTNCNRSDFLVRCKNHRVSIVNWKSELKQFYSCPADWYTLILRKLNTSEEIRRTYIEKFPYTISSLSSYTLFDIIILHKDQKILSRRVRTLEAPVKVSNLRSLISDTSVILSWTVFNGFNNSQYPEEKILEYKVTLQIKEYHGCKDSKFILNNPNTTYFTKDITTIMIKHLHPYALYNAQVVAYNSKYISAPEEITFETSESAIATEVYSNVNVQDWNMTWASPKDCKTITGPLYARIRIHGVSDNVKNVTMMKQTAYNYLSLKTIHLYGAERYVAKLYVVRHPAALENQSAYEEYKFETPPKAPPKIINLEVYEIDSRQSPAMMYLRWQCPPPPVNGILHVYRIRSCGRNNCTITEVQADAVCKLWDNYICGSTQRYLNTEQTIEVVAYNMNVSEPGIPFVVSTRNLDNTLPDQPDNFTVTTLNNSMVDLQWCHPWKTGNPLEYFLIQIHLTHTNLQTLSDKDELPKNHILPINVKCMVSNYTPNYHKQLYLLPSTQYVASIQAVTHAGKFSKVMYNNFETPSTLKFSGHLKYMLSDSMVSLDIPPVSYNTKNSTIHIVVKGPKPCEGYSKVPENLQTQIGLKMNDDVWQAAELPTEKLVGKSFIVGDNQFYGKAKNCLLQPNKLYEMIVIVTDHNQKLYSEPSTLKILIYIDVSSTHHLKWIIPLILIIIGTAGIAFYFYRRKKQELIKQQMQNEKILSQDVSNKETQVQGDIKLEVKSTDSSQQ